MNEINIPYKEFESETLITIFILADLLKITPKRATEIYLLERAKSVQKEDRRKTSKVM